MKELSLNILDIAQNSLAAGASLVEIRIEETEARLEFVITDNGCGMSAETVKNVLSPFSTTRTTRKVGMGLPLLKLAAEQTGGEIKISSVPRGTAGAQSGTTVRAVFNKMSIDFTPLGDVTSTLLTLIQGNPETDFLYAHRFGGKTAELDTREIREILGTDVPIDSIEVLKWIPENVSWQEQELFVC
jgi:hypothetical protein